MSLLMIKTSSAAVLLKSWTLWIFSSLYPDDDHIPNSRSFSSSSYALYPISRSSPSISCFDSSIPPSSSFSPGSSPSPCASCPSQPTSSPSLSLLKIHNDYLLDKCGVNKYFIRLDIEILSLMIIKTSSAVVPLSLWTLWISSSLYPDDDHIPNFRSFSSSSDAPYPNSRSSPSNSCSDSSIPPCSSSSPDSSPSPCASCPSRPISFPSWTPS